MRRYIAVFKLGDEHLRKRKYQHTIFSKLNTIYTSNGLGVTQFLATKDNNLLLQI